MLIYDVIKNDHDVQRDLLKRLVSSEAGTDERRGLIEELRLELIPHARAEEAVFYNGLRQIKNDELQKLIFHDGFREHVQVEAILHGLSGAEGLHFGDSLCTKLQHDLLHHFGEEEDEMFPAARQLLTKDEAEMMGEAFSRLKNEYKKQSDFMNSAEFLVNLMPDRLRPETHQI